MNIQLHPEAPQIKERLEKEQIQALYHFTSIKNLAGIRDMNALCSKEILEKNQKWPVPEPGGNDISHEQDFFWKKNWNKISLNFTPYTPMAYHRKREYHLCFFVIDPTVATWAGVVFTNTNATAKGHKRDSGLRGLNLIDFSVFPSRQDQQEDKESYKSKVQAEVLVPDRIPLEYVRRVVFVSRASKEEAERLWGSRPPLNFDIEPSLFCNFEPPRCCDVRNYIHFPYLEEMLITDTPENGGKPLEDSNFFSEKPLFKSGKPVFVFAKVHIPNSSNVHDIKDITYDIHIKDITYAHWTKDQNIPQMVNRTAQKSISLELKCLPDGEYSVEFRIKFAYERKKDNGFKDVKVVWATKFFKVVR